MTRSAIVVWVVFVCVPASGCAPPRVDRASASRDAPRIEDRRPEIGQKLGGDDVTQLVREQNATEPPLPTRKGTVSVTHRRPIVRRTSDGFVARLPGARNVPTPAYHRGRIYAGGAGTYEMFAIDAQSGKSVWSARLSDDGPTDPACKDGICVFNTFSCTIFSMEADTGRHLWSWYLGSPQLATPVIAGDVVYTSYPDRGSGTPEAPFVLGAFDLRTGKPLWRRWIDAEVNSTPVADGGHVYVATRVGTLYQFSADQGHVVAVHRNRIASAPVLTAQGLLFGRDLVDRDNDTLATSVTLFPEIEGVAIEPREVAQKPRPLVAQQRLIRVEDGVVSATHLASGRRLWQRRLDAESPANVPAPMLYAGRSILLATSAGNVLRMEPDTGDVVAAFSLGQGPLSSQPIAIDGWLYAGTHRGAVVAFDTGSPELTGWEMLGGGPDRRGAGDPEGT